MKSKFYLLITVLVLSFTATANTIQLNAPKEESQTVMTGIEVLASNDFKILEGKRVGLITNATGITRDFRSTIDVLYRARSFKMVALFAPEHGVRGDVYAGDKVSATKDERTGIPIYSIYGKTRKPTAEMLKGIDVLVYDIQDIGCRSYTFISTMGLAMQAAAENGIEFVVLDRPNPLGGLKIEGNYVDKDCISFVSQFQIPYIYGQTPGELAYMLNETNALGIKCKLTVVAMRGWKRSMTWEQTGLPWVPASPHIPFAETAKYYPMTGILGELGYVNIGVGYTMPFQMIGAPWINADSLTRELNILKLQGVKFRPIHYKPFYSVFKGEKCGGVQIHITNYEKVRLTEVQFYVMQALNKLYPNRATLHYANKDRFAMFDKVCGSHEIRNFFKENHQWSDVEKFFTKDENEYRDISTKFYIYE